MTKAMAWALEDPSPLAARAYSGIVWAAMPVLAPRLDLAQRQAFCKVHYLHRPNPNTEP